MLLHQKASCGHALHSAGRRSNRAAFKCFSSHTTPSVPEALVSTRPVHELKSSLADVAKACNPQQLIAEAPSSVGSNYTPWAVAGGVALALLALKRVYDTPSRTYNNNVGDEYDAWTNEGILEYYWGEHIHLGYYTEEERAAGWWKADFKANKLRFTQEMFKFSGSQQPKRILDVGCGFGGSSRWLASQFPDAEVIGITLSHKQVQRGTELAAERGLNNVKFMVMDALKMQFADDSFDLVWACESGEHMPDKKAYVEEMARVLAPGGKMVIACWCQREAGVNGAPPLSPKEQEDLNFLYEEWAHPFFISIQEFCRLMQGTGKLEQVGSEDWTPQTIDSWRHSNLVGVLDPWFVVFKWNPKVWYKVTREIVTLERMHQAFAKGLMQYGLMRAMKPAKVVQEAGSSGSTSSSTSSSSSSSSISSQESQAAAAAASV
uniref:Methyltransferase domain-containing protein n=1 Tax=Tetradesmus obliquus TaxID=3088 RepID=A0A383V9Y5_TETOB|eukprot:jgi/Sobl393_1/13726/SZX61156.1